MAKTVIVSKPHVAVKLNELPADLPQLLKDIKGHGALFRGQGVDKPLWPSLARVTPKAGTALDLEARLMREFRRYAMPYGQIETLSDWDILSMAQHHGLPTRLLDWTTNPLAAIWFALDDAMRQRSRYAVVWRLTYDVASVVDEKTDKPFSVERTMVFQPRIVSARIAAQNSWFTVSAFNPPKPDVKRSTAFQNGFIALERHSKHKSNMTKFRIDSTSFSAMRTALHTLGVSQHSLFPDMDGLCRHLRWLHTAEYVDVPLIPRPGLGGGLSSSVSDRWSLPVSVNDLYGS